jgi:hypothetical protein
VRQPPVWSNGAAATANESSSPRNINQHNRFAANLGAGGAGAPIITARRSLLILNINRCALTVRRSGALGTRITGSAIASSTGLLANGIVRGSTFETKSGVCAILQTTTQFWT